LKTPLMLLVRFKRIRLDIFSLPIVFSTLNLQKILLF
jgi:hypothetical protein